MPRPSQLAHVWTPSGIVTVPIDGDWPTLIVLGAWVYYGSRAADMGPLEHVGRRTGVRVMDYMARSELRHWPARDLVHALRVEEA